MGNQPDELRSDVDEDGIQPDGPRELINTYDDPKVGQLQVYTSINGYNGKKITYIDGYAISKDPKQAVKIDELPIKDGGDGSEQHPYEQLYRDGSYRRQLMFYVQLQANITGETVCYYFTPGNVADCRPDPGFPDNFRF